MNIEDDVHITRVQMARVKCYIYIYCIYTHIIICMSIYIERDRPKIQEVIFLWYETLWSWDLGDLGTPRSAGDCRCGSYDSVNSSLFLLALYARGLLFKITRAAWLLFSDIFLCPKSEVIVTSPAAFSWSVYIKEVMSHGPKRPNPSFFIHPRLAATTAASAPLFVHTVHDLQSCCMKRAREAPIENRQRPAWQPRTLQVNSILCLCLDGDFRCFHLQCFGNSAMMQLVTDMWCVPSARQEVNPNAANTTRKATDA